MPAFIIMALFLLIAGQQLGEGHFILNPPAPEPLCDCSADLYDCSDFVTQWEAQQCFDSCWVVTGLDIHKLDGDGVACEGWTVGAGPACTVGMQNRT